MTKWKLLEESGRFFGRCEKIGEVSSWFLEIPVGSWKEREDRRRIKLFLEGARR
jgi:hypothetical protein